MQTLHKLRTAGNRGGKNIRSVPPRVGIGIGAIVVGAALAISLHQRSQATGGLSPFGNPAAAANTYLNPVPAGIPQTPQAPSYNAIVSVETVAVGADGSRRSHTPTGRVAIQWPAQAQMQLRDDEGNPRSLVVADGKSLWTLTLPRKHQPANVPASSAAASLAGEGDSGQPPVARPVYRQEPLAAPPAHPGDPPINRLPEAIQRGGLIGPEFAATIAGRDPVEEWKQSGTGVSISPGGERALDGIPVRVLVATFPNTSGSVRGGGKGNATAPPPGRTVTLVYGVADGRLRRVVSETRLPDGSLMRRTETHSDIHVGEKLPDSLFVFTPPPGAVAAAPLPPPPAPPLVSSLAQNAPQVPRSALYRVGSVRPPDQPTGPSVTPLFRTAGVGGNNAAPATTVGISGSATTGDSPRPAEATGSSNGPATLAAAPLSVLPSEGIRVAEPGVALADFGCVTLLERRTVERTFLVRNTRESPLTLVRAQGACDCLSVVARDPEGLSVNSPAALATRKPLSLPLVLAPGKSLAVTVTLDLAEIDADSRGRGMAMGPGGAVTRSVLLVAKERPGAGRSGGVEPGMPPGGSVVARLELVGKVKPLVTVEPAQAAFGPVPAASLMGNGTGQAGGGKSKAGKGGAATNGGGVTFPIVVTLAPEMLARHRALGLPRPELASASPEVACVPDPDASGLGEGQFRYRVAIAPGTPLGPFSVRLAFPDAEEGAEANGGALSRFATSSPRKLSPEEVAGRKTLLLAWRHARTPLVTGEVVGDVAASPNALDFGYVAADSTEVAKATRTRTVVVTAKKAGMLTAESISKLRLGGDSPYVTVTRVSGGTGGDKAGGSDGMVTLSVTLSTDAPPGALSAHVFVGLPGGETLSVPVSAQVPARAVATPPKPGAGGKGNARPFAPKSSGRKTTTPGQSGRGGGSPRGSKP